jgi:hypothetical protein
MLGLKEHIEWAAQDDALGAVGQFLRDRERKIGRMKPL